MIKLTQLQNAEYAKQLEGLERERKLLEELKEEQSTRFSLKNRKMFFKDLHTLEMLILLQGPPKKWPTTFRYHNSVTHWNIAFKF